MLAALVGLVIGYSSLRLSRHAFAIVSLSFALLCMIVARDWVSLTRGAMGIPGLPVPSMELPGRPALAPRRSPPTSTTCCWASP